MTSSKLYFISNSFHLYTKYIKQNLCQLLIFLKKESKSQFRNDFTLFLSIYFQFKPNPKKISNQSFDYMVEISYLFGCLLVMNWFLKSHFSYPI